MTIEHPRKLKIGNRVGLNRGVWISAHGGVEIGDDTVVGPYVVIHSANHQKSRLDTPIREQGYTLEMVQIGSDVWIGAHAVVLPGAKIGSGSVIGAGAVVTGDIPPGSIAVGVPAKPISRR